MPWFKVDDGLHSHPKALAAGDAALGLWVRLGSWSSNHLTDGLVPGNVATLLGKPAVLRKLVQVGLLDREGEDYRLHDFHEYNPSREKVLADRAATASRVAAYRGRKNDSGNGVTNAVGTASPTRPDPTPPVLGSPWDEEVEVDVGAGSTSEDLYEVEVDASPEEIEAIRSAALRFAERCGVDPTTVPLVRARGAA